MCICVRIIFYVCVLLLFYFILRMVCSRFDAVDHQAFVIGHGVWLIVVYTTNGVMLTHCWRLFRHLIHRTHLVSEIIIVIIELIAAWIVYYHFAGDDKIGMAEKYNESPIIYQFN